jgi:energy-coupling factor transporter ATP-binding protein EcfA2
MIKTAAFKNFKALKDVSLDLEPFTVLVGPNGSGKTSILEGLRFLAKHGECPHAWRTMKWDSLHTGGKGAAPGDNIVFMCSGDQGRLTVTLGPPNVRPRLGPTPWGSSVQVSDGAEVIPPAAFVRFDPHRLAAASYRSKAAARLRDDGEGLASVLAYLAAEKPPVFEAIQEGIRRVVSSVRAVRSLPILIRRKRRKIVTIDGKKYTRVKVSLFWGHAIEFDTDAGVGLPASMMSEGTLLVLGLLTVIMGPGHPRLVLWDDIDRALHPKAQGEVVELLRRLQSQNPELQIVATSHSPYLVDHLKAEEVRLTTLTPEGFVAVARLDRHPQFEKWKDETSPGEFWSFVGEKWVAEGVREQAS